MSATSRSRCSTAGSTHEISAALHITEYTVQDHLRKIFDKTGVRSRRELTTTLFTRHYLPFLAHPPLSTDGRLLTSPGTGAAGPAQRPGVRTPSREPSLFRA
ncbi:LuxR C-terminal-related transcriptional regulator [Streptacidiphilus griseoplanus]|uniref:LuxR C-terminal-related transcriptional regulator n=1 Tax=Peterkaempfera griseoplana TaxID=66896 RepID=UPI0006E31411|nr:LuxR C-terminal-related transcriptional regulator [Peterkaempfera griseoplana]